MLHHPIVCPKSHMDIQEMNPGLQSVKPLINHLCYGMAYHYKIYEYTTHMHKSFFLYNSSVSLIDNHRCYTLQWNTEMFVVTMLVFNQMLTCRNFIKIHTLLSGSIMP